MTEDALFEVRRAKAEAMRAAGLNPYANDFQPTVTTAAIRRALEDVAPGTEPDLPEERLAGRVKASRLMGKAAFLQLQDRDGEVQLYLRKDAVGDEAFERFRQHLDIGDVIGATGRPMKTKTGEPTLKLSSWRLLTKALRPLPEKWHGLKDAETRYRQRYLDLIANPDVAETFRRRTRIVSAIRRFLDARGFLEVETPQLQALASGAAARPFKTHHNALGMDLYMRIAPELYLKRLLVGGFERVYEIGRNFRNEGTSTQHNPEFTMLEFYQAYATYDDLIRLTEEMVGAVAQEVCGTTRVEYQGETIDLTPPWTRLSVKDAVLLHAPASPADLETLPAALRFAAAGRVPLGALRKALRFTGLQGITDDMGARELVAAVEAAEVEGALESTAAAAIVQSALGLVLVRLFEHCAEKKLRQPTFVTDYPLVVSPLSRKKDADATLVDRFELYITGREMANAFSELNDPVDQRGRFEDQLRARERGDDEAMPIDDDYVRALEHGMPPAAGEGLGIDRLAMLLCDRASIRDVILFPLMRPETEGAPAGTDAADEGGAPRAAPDEPRGET